MFPSRTQRGNVLFLILIAVILFGALAYAVSRSNRSSSGASEEKQSVDYSTYAELMNLAQTQLMRLRVSGCALDNIPANAAASVSSKPNCNFFSAQGGPYPVPKMPLVTDAQLYLVYVPNVGANDKPDVLIKIMLNASNAAKEMCRIVNLRNGNAYALNTSDSVIETNKATWNENSLAATGTPNWPAEFEGKTQGCIYETADGGYDMFQVIEQR